MFALASWTNGNPFPYIWAYHAIVPTAKAVEPYAAVREAKKGALAAPPAWVEACLTEDCIEPRTDDRKAARAGLNRCAILIWRALVVHGKGGRIEISDSEEKRESKSSMANYSTFAFSLSFSLQRVLAHALRIRLHAFTEPFHNSTFSVQLDSSRSKYFFFLTFSTQGAVKGWI